MANFRLENTPNPNTIKINSDTLLHAGTIEFKREKETNSEFAKEVFKVEGVEGIFILKDFLTVTKNESAKFNEITPKVIDLLNEYITAGKSLGDVVAVESRGDLTDIETKIHDVLDKYIRPAVAQDGGDVTFQEFTDGTLYVKMIGSCHGCPSSTATLKGGIERMMSNMVPEVHTVEAV
jgi:Fe-S cluster biogenesis protein NfuA